MGKDNGVAKKLQDRVGNHLIKVHCVAHNLELAILDVVNDEDMQALNNLESTCNHGEKNHKKRMGKKGRPFKMCEILEIFTQKLKKICRSESHKDRN